MSLVCIMRANEESVTKSARLRVIWARKLAELGTTPATGRCPGWLRLDKGTDWFVEREQETNVMALKARSLSVVARQWKAVTETSPAQGLLCAHLGRSGAWDSAPKADVVSASAVAVGSDAEEDVGADRDGPAGKPRLLVGQGFRGEDHQSVGAAGLHHTGGHAGGAQAAAVRQPLNIWVTVEAKACSSPART